MPKQTKSQKKQSGKIKRTLGWFKPTTPSKGMLLFALVFAIIGGGILVYQSYAATYYISIPANTIKSVSKGHCRMQFTGGNYLGVAYTKARVRTITAGKRCQISSVGVTTSVGSSSHTQSPVWSSTSWSTFYQAQVGPIASFSTGAVTIKNVETGNYDIYSFTIY